MKLGILFKIIAKIIKLCHNCFEKKSIFWYLVRTKPSNGIDKRKSIIMEISEFKIICLETLNSFHDFKNQGDKIVFKNMPCCTCKQLVDIEVIKTSSGFGFINGNLSEPKNGQLLVQCARCANDIAKIKSWFIVIIRLNIDLFQTVNALAPFKTVLSALKYVTFLN